MSFRRMTRMISFRVSEQEFEHLRNKSEAQGARSVSDYARIALCGSANSLEGPPENMLQLSDGLQQLRMDVRRLTELLEDGHPAARATEHAHNGNGNGTNGNGRVGNA